jgi:glycosyltransferase involved in cell wall biosynthesis
VSKIHISIIICTCNRVPSLQKTLKALGRAGVRPDWDVEVLVVDNASTDETAKTVQAMTLPNANLHYIYEPVKGLGHARNAGLARARGEIIVFTDDDVEVAPEWIEELVAPLANQSCEAVTGRITLAPGLLRPWMTRMHKVWLASSDDFELCEGSRELIGANMGFRRSVLDRVSAIDPELGAGRLGTAEETLFGWQLVEAGFRIQYVPTAKVIHHLDASRLLRRHWLGDAVKRGRSKAYLRYHWEHDDVQVPRLARLLYRMKLQLRRRLQPPPPDDGEGCPLWEMSYVASMALCDQFCLERQRPRNYSRRGLVKRPQSGAGLTPMVRSGSLAKI